jgi:DNA-binding transcriptional MerR regulator
MQHERIPLVIDHLDGQQALFELPEGADAEQVGFRGTVACSAAGISYRQLDYWARTGLATPSIRAASGSGSARLYSFGDILLLQVVRRLLDTGVSLANIRAAVTHLRGVPAERLSAVTLISDGVTVYACTSPEDVTDIVRGGQGVFGIAIGQVWNQVQGDLSQFPAERADRPADEPVPGDELAARRLRRRTAS